MASRKKSRSRRLIRYGLTAVLLISGPIACGSEMMLKQQLFAGRKPRLGMPFVLPVHPAPTKQTQDGFIVSAGGTVIQDTPAWEAIKLIETRQWVKAIQKIGALDSAKHDLVIDESGVLRPLPAIKRALIASMPTEGRNAFRKLNDPAANAKLAHAIAATELAEQAKAFQSIVDDYALCDAAAQAALRLGDIRLEQGRFSEAAAYYRFTASHPATTADDPALLARRLTALSRDQQWRAFDELAEYARFRHGETSVKIAGQHTALQPFITQLAWSRSDEPIAEPTDRPPKIALPNATDFNYKRMLFHQNKLKLVKLTANNHRMGSIIDQSLAPLVASDKDRLFTLAMGRVTRIDPETGTEQWGYGSTDEAAKSLQSSMHELANGYHQSLVLHGDTLLVSLPDKQTISRSYPLALDTETGKEKWNLRDTLRYNSEGIVGKPIVIGQLLYFVTYRSNQDVALRSVKLADGKQVGMLSLGKASIDSHMNAPAELSPRLTMGHNHLLIQTNNGALIAVDPKTMKIAWAYSQKIRPSGLAMMRQHGYAVADPLARHTGTVIAAKGTVIAKDTRTSQIVALREHDAAMLWQTQVGPDATIVHHNNKHLYVLGKELIALDLRTGQRIWWTPHPGEKAGKPLFTKDACLIAGNRRLCRIELNTGKLTHYREDLTQAASLHVVGQQLISLNHQGITAMRLP